MTTEPYLPSRGCHEVSSWAELEAFEPHIRAYWSELCSGPGDFRPLSVVGHVSFEPRKFVDPDRRAIYLTEPDVHDLFECPRTWIHWIGSPCFTSPIPISRAMTRFMLMERHGTGG